MNLPFTIPRVKRAFLRKRRVSVCALAFTLPMFLVGCQKSSAGAPGGGSDAVLVQVRIATSAKIPDTTEYLSILKSRHAAAINPQVEGQIIKIFVKSGDHVAPGTLLLQIDPLKQEATVNSQEASRAAQEANLRYAKVSLERAQKLHDAGVISKQELDNAQTAYDAAGAQLKALDEQVKQQKVELHYYGVSSPMEGIVGDIPVHVGDRVTVATLLTTVDEPGALEAYVYVPAERARNLKVGLPVRLFDSAGTTVSETSLTFVSPQVDTDTQTVLAKATVQNPKSKVRIAQQVRAQITWGYHDGPVIPVLAVQRINGQFFAFVSAYEGKGAVARQRLVKVGDTFGNDFVVLDGIRTGDHIIVSGTQFLQDGLPITEQIQSDGKGAAAK